MKKKAGFLKGAAILALGGILSKAAGAIYRIPLTNMLGAEGTGLYHIIFPFYTLLLALSSAGIPVALSRLIAERLRLKDYKGADKIFTTAFALMSFGGAVFSALLYFYSAQIAAFQGNSAATAGYRMISPAVLFVAQISVIRGYFQGRMSMAPTAFSQIVEQAVKILFTVTVALEFLPDIVKAVAYSVLAVSVSEIAALIVLILIYYFSKKKLRVKETQSVSIKGTSYIKWAGIIFAVSLPITVGSIIFPLSHIIDSVMVYKILGGYYDGSITSLYGILNGPVGSLTGLPVVVASAVAIAVVPALSADRIKEEKENIKNKTEFALKLTLLIAIPSSLGLLIFSEDIIRLLYPRLSTAETSSASLLLEISSFTVLFICVMQTAVSVLVALKRSTLATFNMIVAVALKISLSMLLLRVPALNIYGLAIATVICYMAAAALNYFYILKFTKIKINGFSVLIKPALCSAITLALSYGIFELLRLFISNNLSLITAVFSAVLLFVIFALRLNVFTEKELEYIPLFKKFKPSAKQSVC
jgi:stage V sporulation protein B